MEREAGLSGRNWVRGSRIGKGSFGALSLAMDGSNGQVFAVKSVNLNSSPLPSIKALENEIQILRSLSSPYIVSYLGDDTTQESPTDTFRNLHLEYMPGGTVADLATKNGPVGEPEVRSYTRCLARALHYLHSFAGVVHGDVKGRNVLIGLSRGAAKLADFGSAMRISGAGEQWTWGTPLWMAPEVVRGERPTPASDVWSLGCTVIEMVTGAQPWKDSGPDALLRIGFGDEVPEFPDHLSKIGRDFLDKCLRRDATERWTSEQLLQHPFLADDAANVTGPSPRSVLDLADSGFCHDDESSSGEDSWPSYGQDEVMGRGRERVMELALDRTVVRWESDGWEVVRSAGEAGSAGDREGGGICREYLDCFGWELEEWSGNGGEASWRGLSNGTRCSASTCCCCCCRRRRRCCHWWCVYYCGCCECLSGCYYCGCCKCLLGWRHGGGVSLAFVLGWCDSLLHTVVVNAMPFFFTLVSLTFLCILATCLVYSSTLSFYCVD